METDRNEFFRWLDATAKAERKGNIKKAFRCLKKARQTAFLGSQAYKDWIVEYNTLILHLLYDKKADMDFLCNALSRHLAQAKESVELPFSLIKEMYIRGLAHILQKQYGRQESFSGYEGLANELAEFVERERRYELDGEDLYAFVYGALGVFYAKTGKTSLAEASLEKVFLHLDRQEPLSQYAFCALVHLAHQYVFSRKAVQAETVCRFLLDKLAAKEAIRPFMLDIQRLVADYAVLLETMLRSDEAYAIIRKCVESGFVRRVCKEDYMLYVYGSYLLQMDQKNQKIPKKQIREIEKVKKQINQDREFLSYAPWARSSFYQFCYYFEKALGGRYPMHYLDKSILTLMKAEIFEVDRQAYFSIMGRAICEYKKNADEKKLLWCAGSLLEKMAEFYSMAEYYEDNAQMEQYLTICKAAFHLAYAAVMDVTSSEKRLEYSINYKNILCSVLRARNRCSGAARRVKRKGEIPYYSYQKLEEQMPEHAVLVEFLYMDREAVWSGNAVSATKKDVCLEIFVKRKGKAPVCRRIEKIFDLEEGIQRFLQCVRDAKGNCKKFARELFCHIFGELETELKDAGQIWASPDQCLCNLPFEVLFEAADSGYFGIPVVYFQSFRDIFEVWQEGNPSMKKSCIIGNPAFCLSENRNLTGQNASLRYIQEISPLPFSGYEAEKIADFFGGECYVGRAVSKRRLKPGYRFLHIATHGIHMQEKENPWYESSLAFSGMLDYLQTGKESFEYGDGILTAEEISRMQLTGTKLAVLSACHSGSSLFTKFEWQTGLHVAFGAAGVHYVVSALWEVDDLAAALFMFYFYERLNQGDLIPAALQSARKKLRDTTVGQVKERLTSDQKFFENIQEDVFSYMEGLWDDFLLYRSPKHWGSFICYQYRGS